MGACKLSCIVKPFRVDAVIACLESFEAVEEILLSEVRGYGRQKGHLDLYRGSEYDLTFLPKVQIDVYLKSPEQSRAIVEAISQVARTGRIGDGKVFQVAMAPVALPGEP